MRIVISSHEGTKNKREGLARCIDGTKNLLNVRMEKIVILYNIQFLITSVLAFLEKKTHKTTPNENRVLDDTQYTAWQSPPKSK